MSLKYLMAGLTLCLTFHTLFADVETITGTVVDGSGAPVEFANATLLTAGESAIVAGAVTDADGNFTLAAATDSCVLHITALGYEEKRISEPRGHLGTIRLSPASYELGELIVKSSRPVAKLQKDGLQVSISGTYLANAGTALDVLGKIPFVLRAGSQLEVTGKGTPAIYINGRQIRDFSELDRLASSDIKSVDVVTSPGARYASTVNAVIIITTVAPLGEGFSFKNRTSLGYKHYVYLFEQANLNFRKGGFDFFATLDYENYRERPRFENNTTRRLPSGTVSQSSSGKDFAEYPVYDGRLGLNYNSNKLYAGLYYDFAYRPSVGSSSTFTSRLLDSALEDELRYKGNSHKRKRRHLLSAYCSGTVAEWELRANIDLLWQINNSTTTETEVSASNPERKFGTNNDVGNRLLAGNITASHPLWKGDVSFGVEVSDILRKDCYLSDADFIPANDTKIKESTSALFAEISQTFGKVSVSAGIRWEYTDSRYYLWGEKKDDQSRKYNNVAPSATLAFPIGEVSANLSYSRKTSRPAFDQLSSVIRYLDRYSYESGNPNLKPVYRDYLSLTSSWRDIIVELSYYSTKNYFMWQTTSLPENGNTILLRMENMPGFNTLEAFANYSPCFFAIWRPSFMAGVLVQDFKLIHNGSEVKLDKPVGVFRFNNAIQLPWALWLNVDFSAQTSGNSDNIYLRSRWNCNLGLYKSFANDTWSIKIQFDDVFNTYRQEMTSFDAVSTSHVKKLYDTRDISLTLRYNFNTARSRYKGSGAGSSEKGRF
ncbi:MAG: TonB dependent receptor [Muribaculaceae bacterium]|nr:TonB dependent receptor [Muribaculaceae bacterium]